MIVELLKKFVFSIGLIFCAGHFTRDLHKMNRFQRFSLKTYTLAKTIKMWHQSQQTKRKIRKGIIVTEIYYVDITKNRSSANKPKKRLFFASKKIRFNRFAMFDMRDSLDESQKSSDFVLEVHYKYMGNRYLALIRNLTFHFPTEWHSFESFVMQYPYSTKINGLKLYRAKTEKDEEVLAFPTNELESLCQGPINCFSTHEIETTSKWILRNYLHFLPNNIIDEHITDYDIFMRYFIGMSAQSSLTFCHMKTRDKKISPPVRKSSFKIVTENDDDDDRSIEITIRDDLIC